MIRKTILIADSSKNDNYKNNGMMVIGIVIIYHHTKMIGTMGYNVYIYTRYKIYIYNIITAITIAMMITIMMIIQTCQKT